MPVVNGRDVRAVLLDVIAANVPSDIRIQNMQQGLILREAVEILGVRNDLVNEQILLTEWRELFRTGYLAWGHDLNNPDPPFCHVTRRGYQAVETLNRDPSNPAGYIAHLDSRSEINDVSRSYLTEGLDCYVAGAYKAAAVMVGAAAEGLILNLRDLVHHKIIEKKYDLPRGLDDWRIKTITIALKSFFDAGKKSMSVKFREEYEAYWPAFSQQIRAVRNEVGHPSSIEPITTDTVHASFLIFPELASLSYMLGQWLADDYE